MAKRDDKVALSAQASLAWVAEELGRYADGVHRLADPAYVLDSELPAALAEVYRTWDGFELFHESVVLRPARTVRVEGDRWLVGSIDGDDVLVGTDGRVWRNEKDTDDLVCEGSSLDRWLAGVVDSQAIVYERDGEFRDGVLGEEGELLAEAAIRRERAALARDKRAPGPRWRLARYLVRGGELEEARGQLEEVVEGMPHFGWAWFDLGRVSEKLGELEGALDELEAAARAATDYPYNGYFWSQVARLARRLGDDERCKQAAREALQHTPTLVRDQIEGARAQLEDDDVEGALELAETACAVAPTDLGALDLLQQIRARLP